MRRLSISVSFETYGISSPGYHIIKFSPGLTNPQLGQFLRIRIIGGLEILTKWTQLILLHPFSARHDEVTHTLSLLQKVRIVATSKLNGLDELTITVELERRWGASNREILWTEIQLQTQGVIEAATFDYSELVKVPQHQEVVLMCHSPRFDPTSCFQPSVPLHLTFVDVRKLGGNGMSVIELLATWLDIARLAASLGEASHAIEALLVQAHTFEKWALHAQ